MGDAQQARAAGRRSSALIAAVGVILFLVSFAIAAVLLPVIERINRARGFTDRPHGRKDHPRPTPYGGGLAIFAAVGIPVLVGLAIAAADGEGRILPDELTRYFPGLLTQAPQILTILFGAAAMLLLGWIDDWRGLSPGVKLVVEAAAAALLVLAGVKITAHVTSPAAHVALTILFVVFATNVANFIDNMNGLLAGVAAIQVACFLAIAAGTGQLFVAAVLICLLGGILAFLPRNFPESSVFLGDAGSLALGFLISAMTIACKFDAGEVTLKPIVLPLLILFVPLLDGVIVTALRLLRGQSPFTAGQDHLSHRITRRGFSREHAVLQLWGLSLLAGAIALAYARVSIPAILFTVVPTVICLAWVARKAV